LPSATGGVEIEENWDQLKTVAVPTGTPATPGLLAPLLSAVPVEVRPRLQAFIAQVGARGRGGGRGWWVAAGGWRLGSWLYTCSFRWVLAQREGGQASSGQGAGQPGGSGAKGLTPLAPRPLLPRGALQVFSLFEDLDCTLLEMNPFTLDGAGSPFPLDMRLELDDTAGFRWAGVRGPRACALRWAPPPTPHPPASR
jgi:ATP citrate (pro-S)-lyase